MKFKFFQMMIGSSFLLFMMACSAPYDLKIAAVDETEFGVFGNKRDALAAIQISDPTLYAREALVNDRRREHAYLMKVLDESEKVQFESELRRELVTISALTSRLGIAFDPGVSKDFLLAQERAQAQQAFDLDKLNVARQQLQDQNRFERERLSQNAEINRLIQQREQNTLEAQVEQQRLQDQINLVRLQIELEALQDRLNDQRDQKETNTPEDGEPATVAEPLGRRDSGLSLNDPQLKDLPQLRDIKVNEADTQKILERLDQRVTVLQGMLQQNASLAQDVQFKLSPEADFAARQAYRSTIRSALAENDLDDLHDLDGNSLYRLQFRASILPGPGKKKNKWGIARYTINNPSITHDELKQLYMEWLAHSSYRMNERETGKNDEARSSLGDSRYELLAAGTGLFEVARINFDPKYEDLGAFDPCRHATSQRQIEVLGCQSVELAVPLGMREVISPALPNFDEFFLKAVTSRIAQLQRLGKAEEINNYFSFNEQSNSEYCIDKFPKQTRDIRTPTLEKLVDLVLDASSSESDIDRNEVLKVAVQNLKNINKVKKRSNLTSVEEFAKLRKLLEGALDEKERKKILTRLREIQSEVLREVIDIVDNLSLQALKRIIPASRAVEIATNYQLAAPAISKSSQGAMRRYGINVADIRKLNNVIDEFESGVQTARDFLLQLESVSNLDKSCRITKKRISQGTEVEASGKTDAITLENIIDHLDNPLKNLEMPPQFCNVLIVDNDKDKCDSSGRQLRLRGEAFAYTTSPVERSQRLSSIANAADAFEFALALSGKAPAQGIAADAGLGASRHATGKVQARENAPLVVGFSGPRRDKPCHWDEDSKKCKKDEAHSAKSKYDAHLRQFGWVFGPRVRLDPEQKELKLEQHVAPYDVSADLSVPGWWPHVNFWLDTAWVGNWDSHQVVELNDKDANNARKISMRLRNNRSDMDGLTNELYKRLLGRSLQTTHVTRVVPKAVSVCQNTADLLIYGSNVWRSTEVYLDGIKAVSESIKVLPDMEGIAASFDTSALRKRSHKANSTLVVWTRDGFDEYRLDVTGNHNGSTCTDQASFTPTIAIESAYPQKLSVCSGPVTFLVTLRGLSGEKEEDFHAEIGGQTAIIKKATKEGSVWNVTLIKPRTKEWQGLSEIPLVIAGKEGVAAKSITLEGDLSKCGKTNQASQSKPSVDTVETTFGGNRMDICSPNVTAILTGSGLSNVSFAEWFNMDKTPKILEKDKKIAFSFTGLPTKQHLDDSINEPHYLRLLNSEYNEIGKVKMAPICTAEIKN